MTAYVVVDMDVRDAEQYAAYRGPAAEAVKQYGGSYLARGGRCETLEGEWYPTRLVVLEFESIEAAHRWYHSPEYTAARTKREGAATGTMVVVEGV